METQDTMELRDLPVDTRNYTIIDNITGKPIDQSTYSLTIDPEVIGKLNKLKLVNEEKIRQATLKGLYKNDTLVDTFTPEDNSVFSPVYDGDYIHPEDYNTQAPVEEKPVEEVVEEKIEEPTAPATEVIQQETLLSRVVARDPSTIVPEDIMETGETLENAENTIENGENTERFSCTKFPTEKFQYRAFENNPDAGDSVPSFRSSWRFFVSTFRNFSFFTLGASAFCQRKNVPECFCYHFRLFSGQ